MARSRYLPDSDAGLLAWAQAFARGIHATPERYALTPEAAAGYRDEVADYQAALERATRPATRGGSTVLKKNQVKAALVASSQRLAMAVTHHPGVTDVDRYNLGLTIRRGTHTPVGVPAMPPRVGIVSTRGARVTLRLSPLGSRGRARPAGVAGAMIDTYVGPTPPSGGEAWQYHGATTQSKHEVCFDPHLPSGTRVWVRAAWFNPTMQRGPSSDPVSVRVIGEELWSAAMGGM